jgi:hypothetical protein
MNQKLCCATLIILAGATTAAFGGPYSILDGTLVKIDSSYQTAVTIGDIPGAVDSIEFSADGFIYGVDSGSDTLVRIDPLSGLSETVGPLGVDFGWDTDLDEDDHGQLWLLQGFVGKLYSIDTTTGAAALQCQANNPEIFGLAIHDGRFLTSSYGPNPPDPGCGFEYVTSYAFYLEKGPDGWIHTLSFEPFGFQYTIYIFSRVNPTTGAHEELGRFGPGGVGDFWGLTFDPTEQPPPAAPIPTLGWSGRTLFTLLLALAGISILTRFWTARI